MSVSSSLKFFEVLKSIEIYLLFFGCFCFFETNLKDVKNLKIAINVSSPNYWFKLFTSK